ncbi:MAG: 1-deoxy-D-xylulose-5-phosphate reductoisomerase [Treponema sp.]|jgi:1-deoxy-D-xylulose-5-phosphate reductoisomerase|nr:1-deoxy-D-xylulose-5-phosphate reductoisomerase [Treponema sp.]
MEKKKRVALLGATGSIGKSALDILRRERAGFDTVLLSAHRDGEGLCRLGREFPAARLVLSGNAPDTAGSGAGIACYGRKGLLEAITASGADIVINGIAGAAGLEPSLAALEAGANLALANKETLVMAGPLVFARAAEKKVHIIPVDSEHSAIFNLLNAHGAENLEEILLTASGGPFRNYTLEQLKEVRPGDALAHPTWKMGPKITIDSATLGNKGLEVIEAVQLFKIPPEKVRVVIHPQSVVHSMIRLKNGAVYAQLSRPDMRLPIQDALYWPEDTGGRIVEHLNFETLTLEFGSPDGGRFPLLPLAYEAARRGRLYPAAYNAANETAAAAFLRGELPFLDIPRIVEYVLGRDWTAAPGDLEEILEGDRKAREFAETYIRTEKL